MEIRYSNKATKSLRKIAKSSSKDAENILDAIENYAANPNIKHDVKKLKGSRGELFRLRVGVFRIIFDNDFNVMNVYEIKNRKDVYQ